MEEYAEAKVVKGGICWVELWLRRDESGLEVFVKADPRIEKFMQGLGGGRKDEIDAYGKEWVAPDPEKQLFIYRMDKDAGGGGYSLNRVAEQLDGLRDGRVNLAFLRISGVSEPDGVRFIIPGPYSKPLLKNLADRLVSESRNLVHDYIVPMHINIRVTSQDI